ncbi:Mu transposase C-terminal domain-containing protein [Desulforegula conservatrix]|uniref:Mu transposase C-terminal domain-containing protein n=1 Tax=Desulforegula conservatrix TaxID=153026 RepID=UPI00041C07B1|nr:Mu transposase C-terminal domain-containing protein [Desulforegula conservatrix]
MNKNNHEKKSPAPFKRWGTTAGSKVRIRIIKRRVWKGVIRVDENDYADQRLREYEGCQVDVGFDPKKPEFVWIRLDDGRGLMASRVVKRNLDIKGGNYAA